MNKSEEECEEIDEIVSAFSNVFMRKENEII